MPAHEPCPRREWGGDLARLAVRVESLAQSPRGDPVLQATWEIAQAIVAQSSDYHRTVAAGKTAVRLLEKGVASGRPKLSKSEAQCLHRIEEQLESLAANQGDLLAEMTAKYGHLVRPASSGL